MFHWIIEGFTCLCLLKHWLYLNFPVNFNKIYAIYCHIIYIPLPWFLVVISFFQPRPLPSSAFFSQWLRRGGLTLKTLPNQCLINPLSPGGHWCPLSLKFQFHFKKGSSKNFPMRVAPESRKTKRAYIRLCPEKRRKKEFGP